MDRLHIDLESRSAVDLPSYGLDKYARDRTTQILMLAYAINDEEVQLWQAHQQDMPPYLRKLLLDSRITKVAWNASFERNLLRFVLGIDIPLCSWEDTMVRARYASLPGHLQDASDALKLPVDQGKSRDGKELIRLFCKPMPGGDPNQMLLAFGDSVEDPVFYHDWNSDPAAWARFGSYCKQDVVAERIIDHKLLPFEFPAGEQNAWVVDQQINERGIYCDLRLIHGALAVANNTRQTAIARIKEITGYANPQSVDQLKKWLETQGYDYDSLGKAFVNRALAGQCNLTPAAREVLLLRQETGKASVRKLAPLSQIVSDDGRLRHQFMFMGAPRTGRWSGKGGHGASVQLQNLPRPIKEVDDKTDLAIDLIRKLDIQGLKTNFSAKPMEVVSSTLRSAFCAAPGKKLIVADLSAVENRVLGWISRCPGILNVFREGRDPYKSFAVFLFNVAYEEVTKDQRQSAKPPVLGCFGKDTLVYTYRGWVPIVDIQLWDLVWDGVEFVSHGGVIDQGEKETIDLFGVRVTPDHLIQIGEDTWTNADVVMRDPRYANQAIDLASGSFAELIGDGNCTTSVFVPAVGRSDLFTVATSNSVNRNPVFDVPTLDCEKRKTEFTLASMLTASYWKGLRTAITRLCRAAKVWAMQRTGMAAAESPVSSPTFMTSSATACHCPVPITQPSRLTGRTTTEITIGEISDLFPQSSTTGTSPISVGWNTMDAGCARPSSGKPTAQRTEQIQPSPANSEKDSHLNRSSESKPDAVVRTYDVLHAGPRNRFTIWTNSGPLLVHNCGYGLSGGEIKLDDEGNPYKTGLMGYAEAMHIDLAQELAHKAVRIFRDTYPEVPRLWKKMIKAAVAAVRNGREIPVNDLIAFDMKAGALRMILPSGRCLHYLNPQVEEKTLQGVNGEYAVENIWFDGKEQGSPHWGRIVTGGTKLTENADQAISRDLLLHGIMKAEQIGLPVIGHVHDEIITETDIDSFYAADDLEHCMRSVPAWAKGLPMDAAGWEGERYRK